MVFGTRGSAVPVKSEVKTSKLIGIGTLLLALILAGAGWYFLVKVPGDVRSAVDSFFASLPAQVTTKYEISEVNVFEKLVRLSNLSVFDAREGYTFNIQELTLSKNDQVDANTVWDVLATDLTGETEDNQLYSSRELILKGWVLPVSESELSTLINGSLLDHLSRSKLESLEFVEFSFSEVGDLRLEGSFSSLLLEDLGGERVGRLVVNSPTITSGNNDLVRLELGSLEAVDIPLLMDLWGDLDPDLLVEELSSIIFGGATIGSLKFKNDSVELSLDRFALGSAADQRLASISVEGLAVEGNNSDIMGQSMESVVVGLLEVENIPIDLLGMQASLEDPRLIAGYFSGGSTITLESLDLLVDNQKHSVAELNLSVGSRLWKEEFYYFSDLSFNVAGLAISPSLLPPDILRQLGEPVLGSVGKVGGGMSASADHREKTVKYQMYLAPKHLGRLDLEIEMDNLPDILFSAADQNWISDIADEDLLIALMEIRPKKLQVRFVDEGLVTVGIEQFARQRGLEVSEAVEILANLIRGGSATANDMRQADMGEELIKFIKSPNELSILIQPPEPITLSDLFGYVLTEPELLDDLLGLRVISQ